MRGLSALELEGLESMATVLEYDIVGNDDPIEAACRACADRGVASYRIDDDGVEWWDINDLGRLALRVHRAVTQVP